MSHTPRRPLPPRRPARRASLRRALGVTSLLLLVAAGIYGGFQIRRDPTVAKYLPPLFSQAFHRTPVADAFPNQKALNLMIIGRDADYDDHTDQVLKSRARSDILMVARLDFEKKTVSLLSIPRDTLAKIHWKGKTVVTKINAAHQKGGPALSEQTVQDNFGIPSDKYVALDFQGFEQAIDLLGGVDLVVDKKMDYDDNWGHLHIHLKPGMQHLDGRNAMGFVRFRHSDNDLVRVQRQQTLIAALKEKLKQPQTLAQIGPLLAAIDNHVDSDLSTDQKVALARFVHDTPREQISMMTMPSHEVGNNVATTWDQAGPVIQKIFGVAPPQVEADAGAGEGGRRHGRHHHHHPVRVASLP